MTAEKCYPTSPAGELDAGAARERPAACAKQTWCVLLSDHAGNCVELARAAHERQDWDLRRPDPRGWNSLKRSREG